jgi:dipeptidyl aminopeptidase/acylaminoacyl peptidase
MFKNLIFITCVIAAAPAIAQPPAAAAAAPPAAAPAASLYGVRDNVEGIDLSPDGHHVVYLQPGPGRETVAYLAEVGSTAQPAVVTASDGRPERLRRCDFVTNDRLVCTVTGVVMSVGQVLIPFRRLIAVDSNGRNVANLGQNESAYDSRLRQYDGEILNYLPDQGAVLMARIHVAEAGVLGTRLTRTANGLGVDRIDIHSLRATPVEQPNDSAGGYMTDAQGTARIMIVQSMRGGMTGQLGARTDYSYRRTGSRDWVPLGTSDGPNAITPLAIDTARDAVYVIKGLNGRDALYRIKLDGSMATELVYANDQVDVDGLAYVNHGARPIGVRFTEERRQIVYFEPEFAAMARALARAIPTLPLIDFLQTSADGNRVLVHAGSDSDAGRYYVFDRTTHTLNEILMVRPQLEHATGASVRAVTYPAADGTQVPAYLTLPPGSTGRGLPAVILPHGGPADRDTWQFDWLPQFLANQGYAVLQANYRGSTGYGDKWLQQNGFRSWRTSIGDITAGARWLAAQGIADPNRMAILGWSYGGYAALQSAATEPGLFKAVVAIAPVTDLQQLKDDFRDYTNAANVAEEIGAGPHVAEGSPLRHADAIAAPVLLFHGDRDLNVNVIHSRRMDDALRGAGKHSEFTIFPGLEHDLDDSQVRVQMLTRIGAFLSSTLGTSAAPH